MFSNTTVVTSLQSQLYADTDFVMLNYFERLWVQWYLWIGNPSVATGLLSFLMHEIVYFGRCLPWVIADMIPYFRKYKLQPNKIPSAKEQWECTKLVLIMHFTIELPQIWFFHPICEHFGMQTYQVPFPSLRVMIPQIALFFVLEDIWHYFAHRALHYGPLYKHIHKLHHKYSAPFGLAAEYAHPIEILVLGMGTVGGPFLYCALNGNLHIVTMYIWVSLRLFQAIDAHSGYDFPWSLRHFIPFWAGAEMHDFHHMAFVNNYATSFRWCDYIFGTDNKYREYRARVAKANKSEKKTLEEKIFAETEREGYRAEEETVKRGDDWDRKHAMTKTKVL